VSSPLRKLYVEQHCDLAKQLIWGSIECALAMKFGGEAKAREISTTQKGFEQILTGLGDIKIIKIFKF